MVNLYRIPMKDGVEHQAQATGLVHDFLVVAGTRCALNCKENPTRELMPVFTFVIALQRYPSQRQ
jgi:hypothetical protein